ncbi:MAG: C40 family peptidase [Acetivibrio ethanolgignens]
MIGWDSRGGTPTKVTAAGSSTTGMTLPFGLDCSGFVTWVFINAMGDPSYANVIGHGARNQYGKYKKISWSEALPGDLVFYPDLGHVGIIAGKNEDGALLVVHCASSQNNVVITGLQGFTKIGRPLLYLRD